MICEVRGFSAQKRVPPEPATLPDPSRLRRAACIAFGIALGFPALTGADTEPTAPAPALTPQLTELFWALFLLVGFVLIGIVLAGLIRRNVRRGTELIRQREAALEEHYRELFENAHDIIFTHDLEGRFTSLNKTGEEILGYSPQEVIGLNITKLIAPGNQGAFGELLDQIKGGRVSTHCELQMRARDGRRVVLQVNLRLQYLSSQPRVQGIAWDITERKQAESALQESEQRLRRSLEERVQLGRDLHDGIIQSIYAVGLGLQECRNLLTQDPEGTRERLARSVSDLNLVIRDVRNFIGGLEPEALTGQTFSAALQSLVTTMSRTPAAQFTLELDAQAADGLNSRQTAHLLQIAREAMSNSLRHARARSTVVSLKKQNGCVRLEVRDDGVGFEREWTAPRGHGLRNIEARALELGARSEIQSTPDKGTCVFVEIPSPPES